MVANFGVPVASGTAVSVVPSAPTFVSAKFAAVTVAGSSSSEKFTVIAAGVPSAALRAMSFAPAEGDVATTRSGTSTVNGWFVHAARAATAATAATASEERRRRMSRSPWCDFWRGKVGVKAAD